MVNPRHDNATSTWCLRVIRTKEGSSRRDQLTTEDLSGKEAVDGDFQAGKELWTKCRPGAVCPDVFVPLLAELVGFECPGARIDDPIVDDACRRVTLHLDSPVSCSGAGREHFSHQVRRAFNASFGDDTQAFDPAIDNAQAISAWAKAGFRVERVVPDHPGGPSLLMAIEPVDSEAF